MCVSLLLFFVVFSVGFWSFLFACNLSFCFLFVQLFIEDSSQVSQHAVSIISFLILHVFIRVPTVLESLKNLSCHFQVRESLCKMNSTTETDSFWIGAFPVKPKNHLLPDSSNN